MRLLRCLATVALTLAAATASASVVFYGHFGPEGPNSPSGTGTVSIRYDESTHVLQFDVVFAGLSSPTTVAHIHCCTAVPNAGNAGVVVEPPSLQNFPVGVFSGHYTEVIDLDDPGNVNPSFVNGVGGGSLANAINLLVAGMSDGRAYFNIHTGRNPSGEIRARLHLPEPGALALVLGGLAAMGAGLLRRRRH